MIQCTARAFAILAAAYPNNRKIDEDTIRFWADELRGFSEQTIEEAARRWARTERFFPNLPNFIGMCREIRGAGDRERALPRPTCAICEDGWVETDEEGRGTVTRCPNGCLPVGMGETLDFKDDRSAPDVFAKAREAQLYAKKRRAEIGDKGYLLERGYSPDEYHIIDGAICWKPPEKREEKKPDCPRCGGGGYIEVSEDIVEDCPVCVPVVS